MFCNIFVQDFHGHLYSSFRWGGASGLQIYDFNKAILTATNMMYRRDKVLSNVDIEILKWIFDKETF